MEINPLSDTLLVAMKTLEKLEVFDSNPDIVMYDVLGDVVCGGFSVPLREKYADEVLIVTSGEYMSLYAANNIVRGIKKLKGNLTGIILNCRNVDNEEKIVADFAEKIGTHIIGTINRSQLIQESELDAKTVVEKYPNSDDTRWKQIMNEETNTSLLNIDEYFINQKVSDYNSKTGIFEGYNYINILVESFDYLAIDKVLTPPYITRISFYDKVE